MSPPADRPPADPAADLHAAEIARLTAALEAAQVRAEEAVRAKTRTLAFMSQEIRVPVGAIVDAVRPLLAAPLGPTERERVSRILRSVGTLRLLLEDLSDLARLEADELRLEQEPFAVETVVGSAVSALREAAEERGMRVESFIDPAVPAKVVGDAAWLRHVLVDLLGMALRDGEAPVLTVRVAVAALDRGRQGLRFTVAEAGPGLIAELRRWTAAGAEGGADGEAPTPPGRAGERALGLHVCRRILGLMGGAVGLSADGTVWFTVGADPGPAAPTAPRDRPSLSILVVEDNPVNQRVNAWLLEKDGHRVTVVGDGRQAVRLVATGGFDAVLMDLDVPGLDGLEATQAIRALRGPEAQVPVIAITASTRPEDVERCRAVGMDDHVPKPVNPAALARVLARLTDPEPPPEAAEFDSAALAALEGVLGADRVRALVDDFLARAATLRTRLERADAPELADVAAELRKTAGTVGLAAVHRTAVALEHAAHEGRMEASTLAVTLDGQLARGVERLRAFVG
ncbi:response regulator [Azospirillum sp.]|uniref:response regulator n=1 Tax=Azospirillum sp. TaxID=34012 RepID=UPI003D741C10